MTDHRFLKEGSSSDPFPNRINVVNRPPVTQTQVEPQPPMYEWDCPNCGERISSAVLPSEWKRPAAAIDPERLESALEIVERGRRRDLALVPDYHGDLNHLRAQAIAAAYNADLSSSKKASNAATEDER